MLITLKYCLKTAPQGLTLSGFQPISPIQAAFRVYFPTPRKYRMARLWTAFIHEKDLSTHKGAM
ncbi:hypothetical protein DPMN_039855 [Dreissena polymorpha]|uniref:Uncharacterized protein n=1 Tax=Dreissena polymorpha TaxID=45954 RepID=A0A9D4CX00_DREPO|nr:hypothetical protein DPMN_039855 [Dreissena polymorpha]